MTSRRERLVSVAVPLAFAAAALAVGPLVHQRALASGAAGGALAEAARALPRRLILLACLVLVAAAFVYALVTSDWSPVLVPAIFAPLALLFSGHGEPVPPYPEPLSLGRRRPTR